MTTEELILVIKRIILVVLTIFAIATVSLSLVQSLGQPQIQSRLELYQTNLILHAAEWQGQSAKSVNPPQSNTNLKAARNAVISDKPFQTAQEQYQQARELAQTTQSKLVTQLQELSAQELAKPAPPTQPNVQFPPVEDAPVSPEQPPPPKVQQWQQSLTQVTQLIHELDLRIGLIQAQQGQTKAAIQTWSQITQPSSPSLELTSIPDISSAQTAKVLVGLWSQPPRILPDGESQIQKDLEGWFRYQALSQLYQLQQRQDALLTLQAQEQEVAQQAIVKLAIVSGIPGFCGLLGVGLLLFLVGQLIMQGKRSLLATNSNVPWETPWNWEIIWQVFILGFFFVGQVFLPILFRLLGVNPISYTIREKAFYVFASYVLMASGGFLVLFFSLRNFFPLPEGWFNLKWRGNWILWGVGGYFVSLPLVIVVSLVNQKLWQGQGGSNPILPLALEGQDTIALIVFFTTACIAAPMFEEVFFRGFLLPSLTRYLPVWGAVVVSALLFAIAHLSISEVLPLATLGIVLGIVYTRSRNLLSSMLLHGLWNAGTLLSLFVLGSGAS
jgi:membrane protease YdiL (CAAX protease family)